MHLSTRKPVQYVQDVSWDGSEEVSIEYQDVKITADKGHYDFPTKTATLDGHVVIDQGPTRLSGSHAVFHLDSKTGTIDDATADLAPAYHIVAKAIDKTGEATYLIHEGLFTSCDLPRPEWSFRLAEASVTLDDYARMKGVTFRAGSVPLFYTPYLIWPTKQDRASGLLVPGIGYSSQRGAYLGLTHYWVTGRSTDLTTGLDLFTKGSVGLGTEFRWTPTSESAGLFRGYVIYDKQATVCVPLSTRRRRAAATVSVRRATASSGSSRRRPSGAGSSVSSTSRKTCRTASAASSPCATIRTSSSWRTTSATSRSPPRARSCRRPSSRRTSATSP